MLSEPSISYKPFWGICRPLNSWRANSPNPIQIYCACLNEMPENQKTVTIMHCLGKLKEKDIANRLKMSEEGVARLLKSGKQKVKNVLDKKRQ